MSEKAPPSRLATTRAALGRQQDYLALLQAVASAANESERLGTVIDEVLAMICENMEWSIGHVWLVDATTGRCMADGRWHPESAAEAMNAGTAIASFGPGEGLVGAVLTSHAPVWISEGLGDATDFHRHGLARELGLQSYVAFPVLARERVVAVMEFFAKVPMYPSDTLVELMANIGAIVGRVAEREVASQQRYDLWRAEIAREAAEQRAAELERLAKELERSNAELDQFAYVASHDLRAPLRGIANLANWLQRDLEEHLDDKSTRYLSLLKGRVERMENLIEGLLAYSRVGRTRTGSEEVAVGKVVRAVISLLGAKDQAEFVIGELPTVHCERVPLEQVFHNLIANALKYGGSKPRIEIRAQRVNDQMWRFEVQDDGPGIEAQYQDRIWQIFQTLKPRDEIEGTGIGLALVKKSVQRHGGRVGLRSGPGEGACFHFTWPNHDGQ